MSVTLRSEDGDILAAEQRTVTLHVHQPNGPDCEPTCFTGGADLL